jgi:tetratricopeptide (TPR) repeat protein/tRNA A-37 threonylcarbamoyl transferase component Bud32
VRGSAAVIGSRVTRDGECLDEEDVLRLFEGQVTADEQARLDRHIDGCPGCLELVAEAARGVAAQGEAPADRVEPGLVVHDRYEILERIGVGATGVVHAAFDQVLDRKVALKVLRTDRVAFDDTRAQARLVREAKILARLSHPNVTIVHDVWQGSDGGVVMAMELVAGSTLRDWLERSPPPSRDEILAVFLSAGRGLAAAHAAGVVHRDFKPDNVLIGADGRVRVTDFGLAHSAPHEATTAVTQPIGAAIDESVSHVAGTPRYMAPEQCDGGAADVRSDQFAFMVTLYEALYRRPPFSVTSAAARLAEIRQGARSLPARDGVTRPLRAALRRGLQADPARRFPSMSALCDAITPAPRQRSRLVAGSVISGVAAAWLGAAMLAPAQDPSAPSCESAAQRLAGVWDDAVRRDLAAAMSHAPELQARWRDIERELSALTVDWSARHDAACAAAQAPDGVEQERAAAVLRCLDDSAEWIQAVTHMAARADPRTLALLGRRGLLGRVIERCDRPEVAREHTLMPDDPAARQRVIELRFQLYEVPMLQAEGQLDEALAVAARAVDEAEDIGFAPVLAEALRQRGIAEHKLGALEDAQKSLELALATAETSRHDVEIAQIWMALAVLDIARARLDQASRSLDRATAFMVRFPLSPRTMAGLNRVRAAILGALGRHREAIAVEAETLAYHESEADDELYVANSLVAQANAYTLLGEWEPALALNRRTLAIRTRLLGADHTRVAGVLNNIGELLLEQGDHAGARDHLQRALAIREGPGKGSAVEVSHVLVNLGALERALGRPEAARDHLERALALREGTLGAHHILVGGALGRLGSLHVEMGEVDAGWPMLERAWTIHDRALGSSHPSTALSLLALAEAELARGQSARALTHLEASWARLASADVSPAARAAGQFALARALVAEHTDLPRAWQLAEAARDGLRPLGPARARELARVEAFLATRPPQ